MNITQWIQAVSAFAIMVLTFVLVWLTRQYANANRSMAQSLERDFSERYRPRPELETEVVEKQSRVYSLEIRVANKGLAPLHLDRMYVGCGDKVLLDQRSLTLGVGETRPVTVPLPLSDLMAETIAVGTTVPLVAEIEYRDLDNVTQRITRRPWAEYLRLKQ
jgi:hypothetical protein